MKWSNVYRMRLMLCGVITVVMLSVVNARGSYFQDDFNRPDGEVGNGWETKTYGTIEVKIVDNEVLIAGQQPVDWWWRSGIFRPVEDETRFSFDFKADDNFTVHIIISDPKTTDGGIDFYASPGGPFSYSYDVSDVWSGWIKIPGSEMIAGEYNTLLVEQEGKEFTLTLNGQYIGTVMNNLPFHAKEVFIGSDAPLGTSGSLHIDNVVIGQPPIITNFDFNDDGTVDVKDVVTLTDYWGQDYSVCDISPMPWGDGIVDAKDLLALATYLEQETALVAHWPLDEAQGVIAYDNAGNHNATLNGNPVWQPTDGKIDGALEFDGIDDYGNAGYVLNPSSGPFSAYAWIKGGTAGQVIISQTDGTGFGGTWLGADQVDGKLFTNLMYFELASESVITDDQWHHVGIVWDGSRRYLYVDEEEVARDTSDMTAIQSNGDLYLGASKILGAGTFFSGLIDDVRIYNRAVSP